MLRLLAREALLSSYCRPSAAPACRFSIGTSQFSSAPQGHQPFIRRSLLTAGATSEAGERAADRRLLSRAPSYPRSVLHNDDRKACVWAKGTQRRRQLEFVVGLGLFAVGGWLLRFYLLQKDVKAKPAFKKSLRLINRHFQGQKCEVIRVQSFTANKPGQQENFTFKARIGQMTGVVRVSVSTRAMNKIICLVFQPDGTSEQPNPEPVYILVEQEH